MLIRSLEILDVKLMGPPPARVKRFSVDAPVQGAGSWTGIMEFGGWAVENRVRMTGVVLICQGAILRSSPLTLRRPDVENHFPGIGPCGFSILLPAWELPPEFEVDVVSVFKDGELVKLATVGGRHTCEPAAPADSLRPLLMTSLGRTGTTHMMRLLAQHPNIVADRTYPYEANAANYWMHMLRVLTRSEAGSPIPEPFDRGNWAQPPFTGLPLRATPVIGAFAAGEYPPIVARFCCESTDRFYRQVAAQQGQSSPAYFCEKGLPSALGFMFRNLYPESREIFLVRDFRDVLCSIFAFNAKRGVMSFGRDHVNSDEEFVPEFKKAVQALLENARGRSPKGCLVRYEDLIMRPRKTLGEILAYLGLDHAPPVLEAMLREGGASAEQFEKHKTSASPRASIGRWKHDLNPGLQKLVRQAFDPLLPTLGYALDPHGDLLLGEPETAPTESAQNLK